MLALLLLTSFECPKTLKTSQSLRDVPAGWTPFVDTTNTRHRLDGVAFYDGNPKEMAQLKPDNGDSDEPPVWTFGARVKGRAIWQVCVYTQTSVTLARAIADNVRSCKLDKELTVTCVAP